MNWRSNSGCKHRCLTVTGSQIRIGRRSSLISMIPRTARSHLCHALSRERAQYANFDDLISFTQVTFAMVSRLTLLAAV